MNAGVVPSVAEFLNQNWAVAVWHDWMSDFCLRLRTNLADNEDIRKLTEELKEIIARGVPLSQQLFYEILEKVSESTKKMIKDETLEYISCNMNHLPMY